MEPFDGSVYPSARHADEVVTSNMTSAHRAL